MLGAPVAVGDRRKGKILMLLCSFQAKVFDPEKYQRVEQYKGR